ncbi:MAG: hypothetical protein LKJ57_05295 [Ancrocorticia sp.]|jgi:hypothetical protein|nr:hypothetical protein [Ancrocorticia sp.]MCI1896494.1 hypothetical protein [Ancrocorticia sp.]MCI1964023.1 hypothetical protein [Ancrocorticia sp.]MCI2001707.1 hypothetical protein [Ancrocorticia sp.]MCI2012997.1 hypothetical protein [Ancrocorticia sp.]
MDKQTPKSPETHGVWSRALADLRAWIAAMFATFGVMLSVYGGFFATAEDLAKGGGINLTLWTGIGMLAVAAAFAVWFFARPQNVSDTPDRDFPDSFADPVTEGDEP